MSEGAAIDIRGLRHSFAGGGTRLQVLDGVDLLVQDGAFVSVVGPSGCGKSTVLRVVAGMLRPEAGEVFVDGEPAIGRPGLAAYMPQRDLLLPWRRALENAVLGAEIAGERREVARSRALALFSTFGLAGFERAWPSQLSGGMRQRLALLRTFLLPARVLLLDEPFGALDAITRQELQSWLEGVWETDRRSVLLITHDVEEALVLSDTIHIMSPRPGRLTTQLPVPLPRPRAATDPDIQRLRAHLLEALRASPEPPRQ